MSIFLVFSWILFSVFIGIIGITRKIGFFGALIISLLLTPLVGFIFTMTSKDKETDMMEKQMLKNTGNYLRYNSYQQKGNYKVIILVVVIFLILTSIAVFFINMYI